MALQLCILFFARGSLFPTTCKLCLVGNILNFERKGQIEFNINPSLMTRALRLKAMLTEIKLESQVKAYV